MALSNSGSDCETNTARVFIVKRLGWREFVDQRRLDYIDTLRGFAAVAVIVFHLRVIASGAPLMTPQWLVGVTNHIFDAGVPLFFALSGFLLTMLAPSYGKHRHPTASFYLKRLFRIAPLFYATILLTYWWASVMPPMGKLLANITFTFNFIPSEADSVVFAGWTIGVEMLFYLVFPAIYSRLPGLILKIAAVIASLVLATLSDSVIISSGIDPRYALLSFAHSLPLFLMGMVVFDVSVRLKAHPRSREIAILLLAGAALSFDLILTQSIFLMPEWYWMGLACGCIILAFALRPIPVVHPLTAFVGRVSYSMYLLHGFVIGRMGHAFLAPYKWGLPPVLAFAASSLIALLVIVPVAWVAFELIEVPGNRFGATIVRWLDRQGDRSVGSGRGTITSPQ